MKQALLILAMASAVAITTPASAQSVRPEAGSTATVQRPAIDTDVLARTLRDRGIPDTDIAVSMERIRYWLSLGASPERIRAFLAGQGGDAVARPNVTRLNESPRAAAATPTVRTFRGAANSGVAVRPAHVQRPDISVRPDVTPPTARGPRLTRPLVGN